jgi:hypothetical protein
VVKQQRGTQLQGENMGLHVIYSPEDVEKAKKYITDHNRVVQRPQFLNNFRLKNSKMRSILQDLFDNQPGY